MQAEELQVSGGKLWWRERHGDEKVHDLESNASMQEKQKVVVFLFFKNAFRLSVRTLASSSD